MSSTTQYVFHHRAVAFLDVLGFRQFLQEFDAEARANRRLPVFDNDEQPQGQGKYVSTKANDFINTFKAAIGQLDEQKYRYYLFSDNICITSITETTAADLQDLLLVLTKLYFDFAKQGYFLRGGIDYGLFIDEDTIAIGKPLAVAYELESKMAVYPRIALSQDIVDQFQAFNASGDKEFDYPFADVLITDAMEGDPIRHLNIFLQVFQSDYEEDRRGFFSDYRAVITHHLSINEGNHRVYEKYRWLAEQFNGFVDEFVNRLAYLDSDFNPESSEGFLEFVVQQKINYGD